MPAERTWLERVRATACPTCRIPAGVVCVERKYNGQDASAFCASRIEDAEKAENAWHYYNNGGKSPCGKDICKDRERYTSIKDDVTCKICISALLKGVLK